MYRGSGGAKDANAKNRARKAPNIARTARSGSNHGRDLGLTITAAKGGYHGNRNDAATIKGSTNGVQYGVSSLVWKANRNHVAASKNNAEQGRFDN